MTYEEMLDELRTICVVCGGGWPCEDSEDPESEQVHEPVLAERDLRWAICSRCEGDGTLGGYPGVYTWDDFAEDPDFYEDYMNHRRPCEDCGGTGKVRELTDEAENRPEVQEWINDWADTEATYRAERAMGA
jgi:hypothetical protein